MVLVITVFYLAVTLTAWLVILQATLYNTNSWVLYERTTATGYRLLLQRTRLVPVLSANQGLCHADIFPARCFLTEKVELTRKVTFWYPGWVFTLTLTLAQCKLARSTLLRMKDKESKTIDY